MAEIQSKHHTILGNKVRALRVSYEWLQSDLARRTGLHRTYIGGVERGEINLSLRQISVLAKALKVEPCELLKSSKQTSETEENQQKLVQRAVAAESKFRKKAEETIYWQAEASKAKRERDRAQKELAQLKKQIARLQAS